MEQLILVVVVLAVLVIVWRILRGLLRLALTIGVIALLAYLVMTYAAR